jgi:hypothetical protein
LAVNSLSTASELELSTNDEYCVMSRSPAAGELELLTDDRSSSLFKLSAVVENLELKEIEDK